MSTIRAIYENGVFRPTTPVDLPDHCQVDLEATIVDGRKTEEAAKPGDDGLDAIYEVLNRRYESGEHDVAERHNEHQP